MPNERLKMLEEINFSWTSRDVEWNAKYQLLKKYFEENGDTQVKKRHPTLGLWTQRQRREYEANNLSTDRIKLLKEIDFFRDHDGELWEKNYQTLKEYYLEHGNSKIPSSDPKIGDWIQLLRRGKKSGTLSDERIRLLNECDFQWDPFEDDWQEKYQLLKEVIGKTGDPLIKTDDPMLGTWVTTQRDAKRKQRLSLERVRLLDDLRFVWDVNEYRWQENFKSLKEYVDQHGDTQVPQNYPVLGKWVSRQRSY